MPKLPKKLLDLYPTLTPKQIKFVVRQVWMAHTNKLKGAWILNHTIPHLGRVRTHGKRKHKRMNKLRAVDRDRKRKLQTEKELQKDYLLF